MLGPVTVPQKRLTYRFMDAEWRRIGPRPVVKPPATRADCKDGPRPCPWVSCKYHLALDVEPHTGSLKINFPTESITGELDMSSMRETCVLDVADTGGVTLERVGELMNLSRERVRQLETIAVKNMRGAVE